MKCLGFVLSTHSVAILKTLDPLSRIIITIKPIPLPSVPLSVSTTVGTDQGGLNYSSDGILSMSSWMDPNQLSDIGSLVTDHLSASNWMDPNQLSDIDSLVIDHLSASSWMDPYHLPEIDSLTA
ncbi:hypothetical protein PoB_004737200 [Plakobranchus ocellatus]|uniref:Uncharacterized protein n=1 Tax=Plakobranchus ocellatus TaxID=259542 RepID=A0AAV4BPI1_9GAST|nr:hypothetical protein PoB_004737200 [Plakobranchus ocellatus]